MTTVTPVELASAAFNQTSSPFSLHPFSSPLTLIKQTSPNQERVSVNGLQKIVHVVVKNAPFTAQIGLVQPVFGNRVIDLNAFTFDCVLFYDTESLDKGVDFVKSKPVDFKATVNEAGDQVTFDLKVKVLTSQHENSYFRVKFVALDPTTGQPFHPSLAVFSESIKVISKPEQLKKKAPQNKKRTVNDLLVETIQRIEHQQQEQQKLIEKLLQHRALAEKHASALSAAAAAAATGTAPSSLPPQSTSQTDQAKQKKGYEDGSEFEIAFRRFFEVYNSLPLDEKPVKIRKLIRNSSTRDTERISEFLDLFLSEGLQRTLKSDSFPGLSGCKCVCCPYQKELERIDEFYKDFLSAPLETDILFN
jgi:hypothetical protein